MEHLFNDCYYLYLQIYILTIELILIIYYYNTFLELTYLICGLNFVKKVYSSETKDELIWYNIIFDYIRQN